METALPSGVSWNISRATSLRVGGTKTSSFSQLLVFLWCALCEYFQLQYGTSRHECSTKPARVREGRE